MEMRRAKKTGSKGTIPIMTPHIRHKIKKTHLLRGALIKAFQDSGTDPQYARTLLDWVLPVIKDQMKNWYTDY